MDNKTVKISFVGNAVTTLTGINVGELIDFIKDDNRNVQHISNENISVYIFKDKICSIEITTRVF